MGIIVKDQGQRSQLQERVATELQEKLRASGRPLEAEKPDHEPYKNTHNTRYAGVLIAFLLVLLFVATMTYFIVVF